MFAQSIYILANHAFGPLARLAAKMLQESPPQSIQMPESLQTHAIKSSKAIEHARLDLHRAGTPNYSFDKCVSFVYILGIKNEGYRQNCRVCQTSS